jgi:TIR domain
MSGVFLSYSRADRDLAVQILQGLRALGIDVWWDEELPGVDWQGELERKAGEVTAVLVVWTPNSSESRHVKDEARLGRRFDKLVNVVVGVSSPPWPYDEINALPLTSWTGREPHSGWTRTVQTIEDLVVKAGGAKPGAFTGALALREAAVRDGQAAVAQAQTAFQEAQAREADANDAAEVAGAAFDRAEAQHAAVVQMRPGPTLLHAAQQQLDATLADKDAADQAQRAAKAALSDASRALARAKTSLEARFAEVGARAPSRAESAGPVAAAPVTPPIELQAAAPAATEAPPPNRPASQEPAQKAAEAQLVVPASRPASPSRAAPAPAASGQGFAALVEWMGRQPPPRTTRVRAAAAKPARPPSRPASNEGLAALIAWLGRQPGERPSTSSGPARASWLRIGVAVAVFVALLIGLSIFWVHTQGETLNGVPVPDDTTSAAAPDTANAAQR